MSNYQSCQATLGEKPSSAICPSCESLFSIDPNRHAHRQGYCCASCWSYGPLNATVTSGGIKHDKGKVKFSLLPWDAIKEVANVFTQGAKKYEERNWEKGMAWSRVFDSTQRHLSDWFQHRMTLDPDGTGLRNIAQATWGCLVLLTWELRGHGIDDRPGEPKDDN